jgi:hypothetical protein
MLHQDSSLGNKVVLLGTDGYIETYGHSLHLSILQEK